MKDLQTKSSKKENINANWVLFSWSKVGRNKDIYFSDKDLAFSYVKRNYPCISLLPSERNPEGCFEGSDIIDNYVKIMSIPSRSKM